MSAGSVQSRAGPPPTIARPRTGRPRDILKPNQARQSRLSGRTNTILENCGQAAPGDQKGAACGALAHGCRRRAAQVGFRAH